jgi:hypothetical protein
VTRKEARDFALPPCLFCGSPAVVIPDNGYGDCSIECYADCECCAGVARAIDQLDEAKRIWSKRA